MLARLSTAGWLLLSCVLARPATAQIAPRILHDGVGCIVAEQHAVIEALVEPTDDLITVKVYFRAEIYPAFFYVEAAPSGGSYRAVLPRPSRDVSAVVYYLEAVDRAFNSFRTEEFRPRVVRDPADCDEDSRQPPYVAAPDGITVGATAAGSSFPPGFLTEGIVGTITAAGRAVGGGSGTLIGIGAAAGAAAGVGVLVGGGDDATTTVPIGGSATTTVTVTTTLTTSVPPTALVACFDTAPNPPTIPVGETVRFDASCSQPRDEIASFVWDFNDGRDGREGRVVTRQYQSAGVFPAELVVTDIRGVQARVEKEVRVNETSGPGPGPGPGPTTTVPGSADLQVTGLNLTTPPPARNAVEAYNVSYRNGGPDLDPTVTLVVSFNAAGAGGAPVPVSTPPNCGTSSGAGSLTVSCSIGSLASGATGSRAISVRFPSQDTYSVTATIFGGASDPNPSNDSRSVNTMIPLKAGNALETAFLSDIQSGTPGPIQASIEMNGLATSTTGGGGPSRHRMKPQPGRNVLAGYAAAADLEGALWKLDFSQTEGFVSGSIAVEAGDAVSFSTHVVVFRLAGSESRIRVRFRMDP